jgi:phage pi2 protein 07
MKFQEQIKERSIKNIKSVMEVPRAREELSITNVLKVARAS